MFLLDEESDLDSLFSYEISLLNSPEHSSSSFESASDSVNDYEEPLFFDNDSIYNFQFSGFLMWLNLFGTI
jgi:hypothetical protein